ncbi:hypothetical protein, variant [Aphanomyces invadans]|uniref:SAM-dependent MTase RsmB/NOP-type domain-containing protein n=1 Tax=Aphanomyces invadans TaxID=157072 RepID=A0A024U5B5_9STRA|nr:hypothetical protein, variant [Aphanomyces invadans]ETW01092.1 hypothetical protein, variant [Aphanomyces invadans]|eukprot:XP_008870090.1 hypothetical protein, variant [Aphanomyces invadans]
MADDQELPATTCTKLQLPEAFMTFVHAHGIDPKVYDVDPSAIPRYFRTLDNANITEEQLRAHFPALEIVPWLPNFYAIPSSTPLVTNELYARGHIFGMEASSGYAVSVLDVQPGDHVLDLCCAPGAKLTMLADVLQKRGSVTGVDFSKSRISACKALVHKYNLIHVPSPSKLESQTPTPVTAWRCRLFHADGRTFQVLPLSNDASSAMETILDTAEITARSAKSHARKRVNKSARARLAKLAKDMPSESDRCATEIGDLDGTGTNTLYDKVLVDAECTHDGSLRHLVKMTTEVDWNKYLDKYLSPAHVQAILDLQHDLIRNGFRLLKEGGRMVYSTCSLSRKQNEDIVEAFLRDEPTAKLEAFDTLNVPHQPGFLDRTIRFTPLENMGGLFVSLFSKSKPTKRQKTDSWTPAAT